MFLGILVETFFAIIGALIILFVFYLPLAMGIEYIRAKEFTKENAKEAFFKNIVMIFKTSLLFGYVSFFSFLLMPYI